MRCHFCHMKNVHSMKQHLYSRDCVSKAYSRNTPKDCVYVSWSLGKKLAQAGLQVYLTSVSVNSYLSANQWRSNVPLVMHVHHDLLYMWNMLNILFPKRELDVLTSENPLDTLDSLWAIRAMGEGFDDAQQESFYPRLRSFLSNGGYKGGMVPLKLRRKK